MAQPWEDAGIATSTAFPLTRSTAALHLLPREKEGPMAQTWEDAGTTTLTAFPLTRSTVSPDLSQGRGDSTPVTFFPQEDAGIT